MKDKKEIFVIGPGRWGTFIAWYLDSIDHKVTLYGRPESKNINQLINTRKNAYLRIKKTLNLTTNMRNIKPADIIVISVPSQHLANLCVQINGLNVRNKIFVLCMKGIEIDTGRRPSEIVSQSLDPSNRIAVWVGPGHVRNFYNGVPNCMIIDSNSENIKTELILNFSSNLIRFYYGTDLIGNEIGAAAKNVMGIAAGMLDGLNLTSLKGALMARGTHEISKLIASMGGKQESAYGLCHLGDYEATLFNDNSHNLAFGRDYVQGKTYEKLAEGYYTAAALKKLSKKYNVELPICEAIYQVLYNNFDPKHTLDSLFQRSLKKEFQ